MSLKTETGLGTKSDQITITKLCTTEREPWDAPTLVGRVLEHLSRYQPVVEPCRDRVTSAIGTYARRDDEVDAPHRSRSGNVADGPMAP